MIRALIEKELRQHGSMIFLFWILIGAGLILTKSNEILSSSGGSGLFLVAWLLLLLFPLACLVLGNALIATEFRQKTQIFLEGLPMPRWKMVAVKYGCGLVVSLLTAFMPLAMILISGWDQEAMDRSFLTLLCLKTALWAWFCWSVIFPFSLLGRYRIIVGLIVVLGLLVAQNVGDVPVHRFGPFELIGDQYAYERVDYPVEAIWTTVGLIVVLTSVGFAMALARDATLATMLSEKMSTREKMAMIALGIATVMIVGSLAERVEDTDPLDLPDSIDIVQTQGAVSIAAAVAEPTAAERAAMQTHVQATAQLVRDLAEFLNIPHLPPLFLIHRRDLSAQEIEEGELDSRQGYLLRLNVLETPAADAKLQSRIVEKLLDAHQHFRLSSDSRGWILEGFAHWWPRRHTASDTESVVQHPSISVTADDLRHWKKFRQRLPEGTAGEFAAQNIKALWARNETGCRAFLTSTLGYAAPHDFRASLHDAWHNVPSQLRQHLNMDLTELATQWNSTATERRSSPSP